MNQNTEAIAAGDFQPVVAETDLSPGELTSVRIGEVNICIARTEGGISAFEDSCPHRQQPLSEGALDGNVLTCAGHTWQFDVRTGNLIKLRAPLCLSMRAVRIRDGMIEVAR